MKTLIYIYIPCSPSGREYSSPGLSASLLICFFPDNLEVLIGEFNFVRAAQIHSESNIPSLIKLVFIMHIYITTLFHHIHFFFVEFFGLRSFGIGSWHILQLELLSLVWYWPRLLWLKQHNCILYNHIYLYNIISINKQNNMCKTIQCVKLEMRMKWF